MFNPLFPSLLLANNVSTWNHLLKPKGQKEIFPLVWAKGQDFFSSRHAQKVNVKLLPTLMFTWQLHDNQRLSAPVLLHWLLCGRGGRGFAESDEVTSHGISD